MRKFWSIGAAVALAVGVPAAVFAEPANVAAAVADVGARSEANVKLDENRKPAELLGFLGLEQGMAVTDMFGGNRYWAEIIAPAIKPGGTLVVWQPTQFLNEKRKAEFDAFSAKQGNVALLVTPFAAPRIGTGLYDFMLMNLDYHDVYWQSDERKIPRMEPDAWVKNLYDAMKPGAVVGIIDHIASPGGDTRAVVEKLHRIDPAVVKADFERAGFVLEAESNLLRNPADDHSLNVFDEKIRGRTDRFIFKFRKPR
jgi:predicted methyltransferase